MPAKSEKQREAMAIAEHEPEKLHKENKGMLKMSHEQLHDFAKKPMKYHGEGRKAHGS
jgi:hypothetical protein